MRLFIRRPLQPVRHARTGRLAAVGLVAAGGGTQQVAAALRYLFATLLGSGAYLLGVALLYGAYGTVSSATLLPLVTAEAPRLVWIAAGLMVTGCCSRRRSSPSISGSRRYGGRRHRCRHCCRHWW